MTPREASVQRGPEGTVQIPLWEEHLRTVLAVLGVVLTGATIAVALLLQWWLVRQSRPRLSLEFSPIPADEDIAPVQLADRNELWVRLKVRSKSGKATAHSAEVLLLRLHRPGASSSVVPSRQLSWADTPSERLAIPSGTWRRVDVLKLVAHSDASRAVLAPALKQYADSGEAAARDVLAEDGLYRLDLAITADEIESSRWRFDFIFHGGCAHSMEDLRRQLEFPPNPLREVRDAP